MSLPARLWQYASERFPPLRNGLLIAAFAAAGVAVGMLAGQHGGAAAGAPPQAAPPQTSELADATTWLVAFAVMFGLFLQLRIADEHKDFATDAAHRPQRPVPRGLVTLRELHWLSVAVGVLALALTLALLPHHALLALAGVWVWMAFMRREFFVPTWLQGQPVAYLLSHMVIMPLIGAFAVAGSLASLPTSAATALPIFAFLALALVQGIVLEVARKCWGPEDEREGIETYSGRWGPGLAGSLVAASLVASGVCTALVVRTLPLPGALLLPGIVVSVIGLAAAVRYVAKPCGPRAKQLEITSGLVVLINYLLLAAGPLFAELPTGDALAMRLLAAGAGSA